MYHIESIEPSVISFDSFFEVVNIFLPQFEHPPCFLSKIQYRVLFRHIPILNAFQKKTIKLMGDPVLSSKPLLIIEHSVIDSSSRFCSQELSSLNIPLVNPERSKVGSPDMHAFTVSLQKPKTSYFVSHLFPKFQDYGINYP